MPLFNDDDLQFTGINQGQADPLAPVNNYSFSDLAKTAVETATSVGMTADAITNSVYSPSNSVPDGFDPFAPENIKGREEYADSYIDVRNREEWNFINSKIERERQNNEKFIGSGMKGVAAALAAGLIDPVNLIPIGGQAANAYKLGKIGQIATGAARVAAAGAAGASINEAIAQATQETRTLRDSVESVAGATVLSGVLGAGIGAIGGRAMDLDKIAPVAEAESRAFADVMSGALRENPSSVGAMEVNNTTLQQENLKSAFGLEKALSGLDPVLRTANSPSRQTRIIAQQLAEQPLVRAKNAEGIPLPQAVETKARGYMAGLYKGMEGFKDSFVKYRLGRERAVGDDLRIMLGQDATKLNEDDFADAVGAAMRRGDTSDIPEVAEAARTIRKEVFDPLKDEAIAAGLLPEGVTPKTAASYLTRVYDHAKIVAERTDFERVISGWLRNSQDDLARITEADVKNAKAGKATFAQLTDADFADIASQVTDKILGGQQSRLAYEPIAMQRGPLKDRTLIIPDELIEPWLVSDIRKVARIYTRTMSQDVELKKAFGRIDMQDQIDAVRAEYDQMRNGVTDKAKLQKLQSQQESDIADLLAMRDRLRGTYSMPTTTAGIAAMRGARVLKNLNYVRLLGGMTISAIPDIARNVMVHGMTRFIGDGIVPMVKNFKAFRLAAEETKLAGTALDMVLDERQMALYDILDDNLSKMTKFERGLDMAASKMGHLSLMAPWNATLKQLSGVMTQTRMLKALENIKSAKPKEIERLAFLGIGREEASRIAKQFTEHGQKIDGVYWAHTEAWTDREAAKIYQNALSKEVNNVIVQPGQDKPLWLSTGLGSVIGQFKAFGFSATQRVLLAGLQQKDAAALNGAILMVGLGTLAYYLKTPQDRLSDDPAVWIQEGIDRSGVTGIAFDINNMVEKATNGNLGVSALTGRQTSRYASRNIMGALLGPSFELGSNVTQVAGAAAQGNFSQSDVKAIRQMLPYQNIFYMRGLFDQAQEGLNQLFNIPKTSPKN